MSQLNKPTTRAKLTFDLVEDMVIRIYNREFQTKVEIARKYKVHHSTIDQILNGISWRKVTDKLEIPLTELKQYIRRNN